MDRVLASEAIDPGSSPGGRVHNRTTPGVVQVQKNMRTVIQRVNSASVTLNSSETRAIERGILVFVGITHKDTPKDAEWMAEKVANLRIFPDQSGKFDRSVLDVKGDVLIVSQFTLYGDSKKGRRPDFTQAAKPELAIPIYNHFVDSFQKTVLNVKTGEFGAEMSINIQNKGPVTLIIDTK
jgi:D-tyrosyl-tRNA(Tyr) deacylase